MGNRRCFSGFFFFSLFLLYFYCAEIHVTWHLSSESFLGALFTGLKYIHTVGCCHNHLPTELFSFFFFNWNVTAWQCRVGFCCTITRSATCVLTRLALEPSSCPAIQPPGHPGVPSWAPCVTQQPPQLSIYTRQCYSPTSPCPLLTPLCPQVHSPSTSLFLPCK